MKGNLMDNIKSVVRNILEFLKKHLFISVISAFVIVALAAILGATIGMNEFIVPVCVLIMIEAAMAAFLRHSEIWLHGVVAIVQLVAGFVINRFPLTILCVVVYVAATVALMLIDREENRKPKFKSKAK